MASANEVPTPDGALLEALHFVESGQPEAAAAALERALALAPTRAELLTSIARQAAELGALEVAAAAAERAVAAGDADADTRFLLARVLVRRVLARGGVGSAMLAEAEAHVRVGLAVAPARARGWSLLAVVLERLGREGEGLEAWREARRLAPDDLEIASGLAVACARQERFEEALPLFAAVAEARPDSADAFVNLGLAWRGLRRWPEASAAFERAGQLSPPTARLELQLGHARLAQGHQAEAIDHFRKALALEPASLEPMLMLGRTLLASAQPAAARTLVARALRLYPDHPEVEALAETLDLRPEGRPAHDPFRPRGPAALDADTGRFPVPDLLDFLANHKACGLLVVEGEGREGAFALRDGLLVAARGAVESTAEEEAVARQGVAALLAVMSWPASRARFYPEDDAPTGGAADGAIELRLVLLEAVRQWDEALGAEPQVGLP